MILTHEAVLAAHSHSIRERCRRITELDRYADDWQRLGVPYPALVEAQEMLEHARQAEFLDPADPEGWAPGTLEELRERGWR